MKTLNKKHFPNYWLMIGAVVFITSLAAYVYITYQTTRAEIMTDIDDRLLSAARNVPLILGDHYHSNLSQLSELDYQKASSQLSAIAKNLGVEYLYTMIYDGSAVRFTASSFTEYDHKIGRVSGLQEAYLEATQINIQAFSSTTPLFEIAQDRWGTFKSVFVPFVSTDGQVYIAGADITLEALENKLAQSVRKASVTASFFFFIAVLVGFLYFLNYRRSLELDASTGYPNRSALSSKLINKQHLHWSVAVIWVKDLEDIIGFYGIPVAEEVMANLMDFFASRCETQSVFRIATGKCAILLKDVQENILFDLVRSFPLYSPVLSNPHICIHLHAGIASGNAQTVMENAYLACRQAKQQGELTVIYRHDNFENVLDHKNHLILTNSIHRAIQSQHIQPFFEPRCKPNSESISQFACSAQIFNEFGQLLVAQRLNPILFNLGLANQLCQILLKICVERFRKDNRNWSMCVPLSAMCDPHFTELLSNELRRYPAPMRITFEVNEQDLISSFTTVATFITQVKSKGVKVLINNVSSGLITVTRVIRLDIDAILLAPQITENVCEDIHVAQYVAHMALQCSAAKVSLGVCNVDTEQQYEKLIALGVDLLQGPFVGAAGPHITEQLAKLSNQARA